ncbi:acyl-CoA N-acyltransferase [Polychaeton citri CBS 116435]|uniref:Acyl-CoA N-acyltransferase n=1 Tax=Polychaeton citri CBS 116435 TaxID=1314669 RepID=A0A9P4UNH5_9PEZI|nr:acyl-CoA N-acyltransferase [Polychaeton citri CBS 116435]
MSEQSHSDEPGFSIRPATTQDVEAIAAIYAGYVKTSIVTLEEQEPSTATMLSRFQSITATGHPYIVATAAVASTTSPSSPSGETIAGYAFTSPFNERTGYRYSVSTSVYLHPDFLRQGLGMTLMRELLAQVKAKGFRQVLAGMSVGVGQAVEEVPSCKMHGRLGFEVVARLKGVGEKFGKVVDVVWMQAEVGNL